MQRIALTTKNFFCTIQYSFVGGQNGQLKINIFAQAIASISVYLTGSSMTVFSQQFLKLLSNYVCTKITIIVQANIVENSKLMSEFQTFQSWRFI